MIINFSKEFEKNFDKRVLEELKTKTIGFLKNSEEFKLKFFFIQAFNLIEESYEEIKTKNTLNKKGAKSNILTEKSTKSKQKNEEEITNTKKSSMKTAGDVVNRIHWDETINREFIMVGYLDRFLGIKEVEFNKFDWGDIVLADIGALAIPEHRIQYFK